MGTIVSIQVAGTGTAHAESVERAFQWFRRIEASCSRFNPESELMRLTSQIGVAVPVSPIVFEAVQFALAVAEETGGAFDPTVGYQMEKSGFSRDYRTGETVQVSVSEGQRANYRDILLDPDRETVTLARPMILDLGAVVKGLAIDMAARELEPFRDYAIDAGGDLYLGGSNPEGLAWSIGIRHPRQDNAVIESISVSNRAVCTSGDYERGSHILDARTGSPAEDAVSATVVAPNAMLADALATAAFILGPVEGIRLLDRMGLEGLIVSPALERFATEGMFRDYKIRPSTVL
jgi:thiamine biosynthesis lipoprotein